MNKATYKREGKFGWWIETNEDNEVVYLVGRNFNLPEEKKE